MTLPVPIWVLKAPRETEESKLFSIKVSDMALAVGLNRVPIHLAIHERSGVVHGDTVALLGEVGAVAGRGGFLGDAHCDFCC